ncbi:MAG TPA: sigma-E factor negative regulatory protein [Woeseiaceae bacterium]|jgi:anti-sigma factor RsiW|nr:sigma-E factor negative regulatory protein [Woeseiaceae bacterium]
MNDAINAQISAFVDGELPENEAELLLRRMSQDRALRQQAAEYLALGRAIRGQRTVAGMASLRDRIAAALDAEAVPEPSSASQSRDLKYVRPLAGVAIAATVALAAIIGLQRVAGIDETAPTQAVAEAESPGYTVPAPAPAEDKLREYYLRHAASSAYVGASSINARLVTLELPDGVQVEVQPEPEAAEETDAAEPAQPTP